jgi:hypothetical protein
MRPAKLPGTLDRGKSTPNEESIPERAILIQQQDGPSRRGHARPRSGRLNFHERDETMDLRLLGNELG